MPQIVTSNKKVFGKSNFKFDSKGSYGKKIFCQIATAAAAVLLLLIVCKNSAYRLEQHTSTICCRYSFSSICTKYLNIFKAFSTVISFYPI